MDALEQRVREASNYKFKAQGEAYFPQAHIGVGTFEQLQAMAPSIKRGTFVMVIDRIADLAHPRVVVAGFRLVECIVFEGQWVYMTAIADSKQGFRLDLLPEDRSAQVDSLSLALICTDNEPYTTFLRRSLDHYREVFQEFENELCVAWFGDRPIDLGPDVKVNRWPMERFHMAYARNRAMGMCTKSHALLIDLDAYLSREQLADLVELMPSTNGVINFCKPVFPFKGNGLIFGERAKMVANGHHEAFQKFYFEDTEYLMNLSRIGTVPWCVFVDFAFVDNHPRGTTRRWFPHNQKLFEEILKRGHR